MPRSKKLWLEVTPDEYELPVAVADSAKELAEMRGSNAMNITTCVWRDKQGYFKSRYKCVEVDEDD